MSEWPFIVESTDLPAPNPNVEPDFFTAGDTLYFLRTAANYPASGGWHLHYSLRGVPGSAIEFDSIAQGDDHLVNIPPATTSQWPSGKYIIQGRAVNVTGEQHAFYTGYLTIRPDLTAAGPDLDVRSHAQKCLDNIEAVLEGRATSDVLNSDIEGTKIERIPVPQLLLFRDRYKAEVRAEEAKGRVRDGKATGRTIFARFTRPAF